MAYCIKLIYQETVAVLSVAPRAAADEVAGKLGVDRHTLHRAVRACGTSFRELQRAATLRALERIAESGPPRSAKLIAFEIGFPSAAALAHYRVRNAPQMSGFAPKRHLDTC